MPVAGPLTALYGRADEVRALGAALDRLTSGRPALALVEGEAGIGKTRLLSETLDRARGLGFQVAVGQCEELEQTRPFGVIADALECTRSSPDPRRAAIGTLLATHGEADEGPITVTSDPGLQFRAVDAVVDLVEELALHTPLVIGLDDLQWADPSSLLTISTIGRRLADLPVALIGCYRPAPRSPQLERTVEFLRAAGAQELTVGPLGEYAVVELVAEMVAAEPSRRLLREMAGAGGNPLFVTELVAAVTQEGLLETTDGRADLVDLTLPPTLRLTILRRLSFLPAIMDSADPGRDALLAERGDNLMWAGRVAESESACRALLDRAHDPAVEGPVRTRLGLALLARGRPADGLVELERAWQSPLLTSADRASGLGWASIIQMWLGDLDGATATAEQARAAAAQVGDQMTATVATAMFAVISLLRGQLDDADRISDEAVGLADRSPARQGHRYPVSAPRAFILLELDRFEDARSTLDLGTRVSEELGSRGTRRAIRWSARSNGSPSGSGTRRYPKSRQAWNWRARAVRRTT